MNILILIGVIVGIYIFFSKGVKRVKFLTSIKKNIFVLGGYAIVLLVSMVIYFMIPDENFMEVQRQGKNQSGFLLFENLMNKEEVDEKYLASVDAYPLKDKELVIRNKAGFAEYNVLFQKTEELQEEIEVQIYKGQFEINEFDFSNELPLPTINYTNNIIEVENAPYFEKNLAFLTPEFPFTQFSGERWEVQGSGSAQSSPIIYINIPKDVDVIWNKDNIIVDEVK
ncbi:hypothetical protein [Bacillus sp. RO1]|uniref:hypothetical protein n=1 Tax=Bacillus sp. RO1 TaxID=2722703 RepID=UPI00145722C5|nr:hypothetical protein [Bacillus sp. RO1]NLP52866.1 hypothetical protein [Bacillus sp. RO1]